MSTKNKKRKEVKHVQTRTEYLMFCLAARAHDGKGNLIWPTLPWK